VLYNVNGFLADFRRAQSNAALSQAANNSYNGEYNAAIAGSQPLTVFPLLANPGFTNATIQNLLRTGQVGELASNYQTTGQNGAINFFTNPNILGANTISNSGSSTYNSVQFDVRKRTRAGLQLQFNYTFSKGLSNAAGDSQTNFEPLLDNNNPALERARSPLDITHSLKANFYYELPYGEGKRWHGNGITNRILGGWAISGIWSYFSGAPYSILSAYGTLNRAGRSTATNTASINGIDGDALKAVTEGVYMTGNGPYLVSPSVIGPDGRGAAAPGSTPFPGQIFYNPTAGNLGNTQRRMFNGPWQWKWDMSVKKQFKIWERHCLDFHFDFFNVMNHPTFYVPPQQGDYASTTAFNINNTTFGKITAMNYDSRVVQIGAYYRF
jgi:hypothetical protein